MILPFITLFLLVAALAASLWLFFSSRNTPILSDENAWMSKGEIGALEETLSRTKEVILVADKINVPTRDNAKEILLALLDNFMDGVQYRFLVPEDYYKRHAQEIRDRYMLIIGLASKLCGKRIDSSLFELYSNPHTHFEPDYPYLFYRFESDDGDKIIAYRGEDLGEGIASHYKRLEPEVARSLLRRALPHIFGEEIGSISSKKYDNFSDSNVLLFDEARKDIPESAI